MACLAPPVARGTERRVVVVTLGVQTDVASVGFQLEFAHLIAKIDLRRPRSQTSVTLFVKYTIGHNLVGPKLTSGNPDFDRNWRIDILSVDRLSGQLLQGCPGHDSLHSLLN